MKKILMIVTLLLNMHAVEAVRVTLPEDKILRDRFACAGLNLNESTIDWIVKKFAGNSMENNQIAKQIFNELKSQQLNELDPLHTANTLTMCMLEDYSDEIKSRSWIAGFVD